MKKSRISLEKGSNKRFDLSENKSVRREYDEFQYSLLKKAVLLPLDGYFKTASDLHLGG